MRIYLIRHAHAVDAEEDRRRPLSRRGGKQIRTALERTGTRWAVLWQIAPALLEPPAD